MIRLGIDIGGTSMKLALLEGERVRWTARSRRYDRPDTAQLIAVLRQAVGGRTIRADAVGACVPGILDQATGTITQAVNVPGLVGIPLREILRSGLGQDVERLSIHTDAVAAAYDMGVARKLTGRLLVLALGTGVGVAVLDDGVPLCVDGNSSGHIGQVDVSLDDHPPIGPDGGAGSLEAYVGARALTGRFGAHVRSRLRRLPGDDPALRALARAIRICHAMYRPAHVGLAGGIGLQLRHACDTLRVLVEKSLTNIARPGWTLFTGHSHYHSALGAARLAVPA